MSPSVPKRANGWHNACARCAKIALCAGEELHWKHLRV